VTLDRTATRARGFRRHRVDFAAHVNVFATRHAREVPRPSRPVDFLLHASVFSTGLALHGRRVDEHGSARYRDPAPSMPLFAGAGLVRRHKAPDPYQECVSPPSTSTDWPVT
jgi:hypothetical protein